MVPFDAYCRSHHVGTVADFLVYVVLRDQPDEPHATLAAEIQRQIHDGRGPAELAAVLPADRVAFLSGAAKEGNVGTVVPHGSGTIAASKVGVVHASVLSTRPFLCEDRRRYAEELAAVALSSRSRDLSQPRRWCLNAAADGTLTPVMCSYIQLHQIGAVLEDWLSAMNHARPADPMKFTQQYFTQVYRAKRKAWGHPERPQAGCEDEPPQAPARGTSGTTEQRITEVERAHEAAHEDDMPAISRCYTPRFLESNPSDTLIRPEDLAAIKLA